MKRNILLLMSVLLASNGTVSQAEVILTTKHNLSISGSGQIRSTTEPRVCIFCHTPHNASEEYPYLWNRSEQSTIYTPYQSSTMSASIGQPTGSSKRCLSCHDGTIALGAVLSRPTEIPFVGGFRFIPPTRPSYLGTDLSDDHPVSFNYQSSIDGGNSELAGTIALPREIKLDSNGDLQCTVCHDPHDDTWGNFLVMSNQFSALCTSCHIKSGWAASTHATSPAQWNGSGIDPWPNTEYISVAENGCENCHRPHSAGRHQRLLNQNLEEDTCLVCHNGNVASSNILVELEKAYSHPVETFAGIHDAAEDFTISGVVPNHVECEDCHNSHLVNNSNPSTAPSVSGRNSGVLGINASGLQVDDAANLYEICFKCHADNNVIAVPAIPRQIGQLNTRLEFSLGNPSYHPVMQATGSTNVPSLIAPYTTNSIIHCTDCHGSDNSGGAQGPHGSIYEHLLVENYSTTDGTTETSDAYALCYKCHSQGVLLSAASPFGHTIHVRQENTPCSVCHDAHGISATQGNPFNNRALINFDTSVVIPNSAGILSFDGNAISEQKCSLSCHGIDHDPNIIPYTR